MGRIKRIIDTEFWTDDKVVNCFSPEDKYFMLYLLSNPHTTQLGIYKFNAKVAAFELGWDKYAVETLLDRFENTYKMIKWSKETNEIAIKNYLRYSIIKGGKPVQDLLNSEAKQVRDKSLFEFVCNAIVDDEHLNNTVREFVSNLINYYLNNNDNENEVSYHDTGNDTYHDTSKKKPYGEMNNVMLTDEEYKKLKERNLLNMINDLSFYISSKGKKYKSHYATICQWSAKDKKTLNKTTKQVGQVI